ncbi:MAG: YfcE family phosphodiesterase [Deltaproteobacteria bacterium]|nr:YfcE family phosphodiesterase [Deltaproteobacteria bacterium]
MIIAILSDSHDNIWNLRKALDLARDNQAGAIIHCGDLISPFMMKELSAFPGPGHCVFGNNDGDIHTLTKKVATEWTNITLHGVIGHVDLDGFAISFSHYKEAALGMAAAQNADLACYGHSHQVEVTQNGRLTIINPGEVMGLHGRPTFYLYDTATRAATEIRL